MTSLDLFDTDAKQNAVDLLRRFVEWTEQHPEGEVLEIGWFVTEARDFLANPFQQPWSNV